MSNGPRLAVLVNPTAAHARRAGRAREILARRYQIEFHTPSDPLAMQNAAAQAINRGCVALVAAGGDGTINCVVNALAGSDIPIGILPLGTANDLARELGLPLTLAAAAQRIVDGSVRRVDLLTVNGRRFCTAGGMGVVACSALAVNRWRNWHALTRNAMRPFGANIYSIFGAVNIISAHALAWRIHLTGHEAITGTPIELDTTVHGLFAANQHRLGANLVLPLESTNDDGVFELCLLNHGPRTRLLRLLWTIRRGLPPPHNSTKILRVSDATMTCDRASPFLGDGDEMVTGREFALRIEKRALSVFR